MAGGVPGNSPYPGGIAPQAPPRRSSSNCLLWGLAGCGVLVIVMFVLGLILAKSGFGNSVASAPSCKEKLVAIRSALQTYQHDHKGKYPAKLSDLVPDYLPDDTDFSYKIGSDVHTIQYTPPDKSAPDDAVVAGFETGQFQLMSVQTQTIHVDLLKNGRIVQDQIARQDLP